MHAHELGHDPRFISYGRAIREICSALESITHHKEGRPAFIDANSDTPAETARSKRLHQALTQKWESWWNTHGHDIVSDADLVTLMARPHDADAIETAGLAVYGPLFPTGAAHHLGPVHDIVLHKWDEQLDTTEIIDFDAERKMTLLELMRRITPTTRISQNESQQWYVALADAACYEQFARLLKPGSENKSLNAGQRLQQSMLVANLDPQSRYYSLYGYDASVWPVDDARWDSLAQEIESGETIVNEPGISNFSADKNGQPLNGRFPATFLFRTHKGVPASCNSWDLMRCGKAFTFAIAWSIRIHMTPHRGRPARCRICCDSGPSDRLHCQDWPAEPSAP